jgi:uncharacterized membrane protein YfcA
LVEFLDPQTILLGVLIYLLSGMVKGVLGIGLPLIGVPLLSFLVPVPTAIALLSIPILLSNLWQMFQGEGLGEAVRRFWPLLLALIVGITIGARLLVGFDQATIDPLLGGLLIVISLVNLVAWRPRISPSMERTLSPAIGLAGGLLGGMTSFFGPPIVLYMVSLRLPREHFISAIAVAYLCGVVPLNVSLAVYEFLTLDEALISLAAMVPVFAGLVIGQRLRRLLPQEVFRKTLLIVLMVIGAMLIRRALIGG